MEWIEISRTNANRESPAIALAGVDQKKEKMKHFPLGGTPEEKRAWVLEQRAESLRIIRSHAEILGVQSEEVLLGATQICSRANFPFSRIRIFAPGGYSSNGWLYDGQVFRPWLKMQEDKNDEHMRLYLDYLTYQCAEIPRYLQGWEPPFALLWFESLDQAQELVGFQVPWVTLGYWRAAEEGDPFGKGAFYRLWLVREQRDIDQYKEGR